MLWLSQSTQRGVAATKSETPACAKPARGKLSAKASRSGEGRRNPKQIRMTKIQMF